MINYKHGDIVLVDFGFSEGVGSKRRPALVISSDKYNHSRQEVIIMAITSNVVRILVGDTKIEKWKEAGLLFPSLVTGIIRTLKNTLIIQKLGVLLHQDFQKVQNNLKDSIGL